MRKLICIILLLILHHSFTLAQVEPINRQLFFVDDKVIETTLTTDLKKLRNDKNIIAWQPAKISMQFADSSVIDEEIRVEPRGLFRKEKCDLASLMFEFKNLTSPKLSPLKKLKMVGGCRTGSLDEELLLKEYLAYKIYNFISIMSFRVRLLHMTYKDSRQKLKPYAQYAFLIEDVKDLSSRNNCKEVKNREFVTEATNRDQMTLVSLFQYMIGNTDWSVPKFHNIKLMVSKNDTLTPPYAVPYDFDFAGIVDASYAVPDEQLGTTSVTERTYRGYVRTPDELQEAINIFKEKKSSIMLLIKNFTPLSERTRNVMIRYLEEFYQTIKDKRSIREAFIANARKN